MIFVTGGTGLVGAHVLLKLSQKGKDFKALKRPLSSLDVCKKIFTYYNADELFKAIKWVDGDLGDIVSLQQGMEDCDFLLHCAAVVSFSSFDTDILKKVNIEGTANVMNVALSCGIKKAGYVSSISALGSNASIINEDCYFQPGKLISNYAFSKYFAEQEVWRASAEGLKVIIINPSVILGPGDWTKGSSQIFEKIYNGLKFYSEGSTGYVDVQDVADALLQLLFSNIKNERFIINGINLKYRDCFDRIALALNRPKASIRLTPFLKEVAWRAETIKSLITGKRPLITKETANNSMTTKLYSSQKIEEALQFKFTDINLTIKKYADWFIADQV